MRRRPLLLIPSLEGRGRPPSRGSVGAWSPRVRGASLSVGHRCVPSLMAMDPPTVYRPQRNIRVLTAAGLFGDSISHDQLLTSSGLPRSLCHSKTQNISDAVELARFLNMLGLELRRLADCRWIASSRRQTSWSTVLPTRSARDAQSPGCD